MENKYPQPCGYAIIFWTLGLQLASAATMWVSGSDIYLEGSIKHEDSARLNYIINNNPQTNRVVIVQSPGGNLYAGIRMGQTIRSKGLETYLHKDCSSACNHIFAGGFFRDMASTARLGLHIGGQTYDYAVYTTRDLLKYNDGPRQQW